MTWYSTKKLAPNMASVVNCGAIMKFSSHRSRPNPNSIQACFLILFDFDCHADDNTQFATGINRNVKPLSVKELNRSSDITLTSAPLSIRTTIILYFLSVSSRESNPEDFPH
ncbi:hypothetical protein L798_09955 [Zootermopsis nevadensis]|uniref:Uncharacterized protein n=1 Tax=Zootermopsis nevadensis TaxID=136037 RepID=A0A067RA18_ZOONE|nr:hypothetical protein L798_09955 [Zootermopsis nevadensis]